MEMRMVNLCAITGLSLIFASWLWAYAGRDGTSKAWRRFGSTAVIALDLTVMFAVMGLWSWWFLLLYPALIGSCIGYGGDNLYEKILRRAVFALSNCAVGVLIAFVLGGQMWFAVYLEVMLAMLTVYFAIKNPFYAPAEEFIVSLFLYSVIVFMPFIVRG